MPVPGPLSSRLALMLVLLAAPVVALGCGGDDDDGGDEAAQPKPVAIETTAQDGRYRIEAPKTVEAGLAEIRFTNSDRRNPHEAQLIRVTGDAAPEAVVRALAGAGEGKPIPDFIRGGGGVTTTGPGQTQSVTQVLEQGRYVVVDTESEGDEAPPFATQGAVAEFEVTGSSDASLPDAPASVTARDYSFQSSGLKAGENEVRFENTGRQPHHVVALLLKPGATLEDATRAFQQEEGEGGDSPFAEEEAEPAGTAVLDAGQSQITSLELKPGKYVLACFISDREGGPPHVAKGMVAEANVR
jgi:hypothetical protein